jgi:ribosomal protein L11 methyltransferase
MAFGTGHNETTQLVLELMLKYLSKKDKYLFDFGCGTGILAIAGIKMGIQKAVADDIDEDSIDNSVENFKLNKVYNKIKLYQNSISGIKEKNFDVICANIISSVIKENLGLMYLKLKPNGKLFLSGVLREEERNLKNHLKKNRFKVIEVIRKSEWIGVYAAKDNC